MVTVQQGIHDDDDEIAYFTVRWKTRASFVYRTIDIRLRPGIATPLVIVG